MMVYGYYILAFVCTLAAVPLARLCAVKAGFLDRPDARKNHERPVPPIGGLVIVPLFIVFSLVMGADIESYWPLFLALLLLMGIGALDDYAHVPPWPKFAAQFIAAGLIVVAGEARIDNLGDMFGLGDLWLGFMAIPFSVVATVLLINAINLMDGLDGLAGGYTAMALSWMGIAALTAGTAAPFLWLLVLILAGVLVYNLRSPVCRRASIFLGDAGSLSLGLLLAWFAMTLTHKTPEAVFPPILTAWILALPIMDTCAQFYRRMRHGRHPFSPDHGHFHHHFIAAGIPHGQATALILSLVFLISGAAYSAVQWYVPSLVLTGLWIAALFTHMAVSYDPARYTRGLQAMYETS